MPWWSWPLIWWVGMAPQAFIIGRIERDRARQRPAQRPYTDAEKAVACVLWPMVWALAPIMALWAMGRRERKRGRGDSDKA